MVGKELLVSKLAISVYDKPTENTLLGRFVIVSLFTGISPVVLPSLDQGEHFIKVTPRGPECNLPGGRKQPLRLKFEI